MSGRLGVALRRRVMQRSQRGAVAVEFALVLPVLIMLLLGTVTAGLAYSRSVGLTNAVREGARFGATTDNSSTWATDVVARTRALQFDDHASPPETLVCAQLRKVGTLAPIRTSGDCSGSRAASVSPTGFQAGDCFVWVAASRDFVILLGIFGKPSGEMSRSSASRYERTCA